MTHGADISLAAGSPAVVDVGTTVHVRIHVRDTCGRPLEGAHVSLAGRQVDTDADGIAAFDGFTTGRAAVAAVTYEARFGSAPTTKISVNRALAFGSSFDPSPKDAPDPMAMRELHEVVVLRVHYPLKHLFAWQNAALRKIIYIDGVSVGRFKKAHPKDDPEKNRFVRLRRVVELFDRDVGSIAKKRADLAEKRAKNDKNLAKIAAEKIEADERQKQIDAGRGGLRLQKRHDEAEAERHARTAEYEAQKAHLERVDALLEEDERSHGGRRHETMIAHVLEVLEAAKLEPWIRYGIVHLTGIRYRPSPGCYQSPRDIVRAMREREIGEVEHPSTGPGTETDEAKRQRTFARGYLALLRADAKLAADVGHLLPGYRSAVWKGNHLGRAAEKNRPPLLEHVERLARSEGPWMQAPRPPDASKREKSPIVPLDLYEMRALAYATTEALMKRASGGGGTNPPPDQGELLGTILDRWFNGQKIPERVWLRAAMSTELLHDFYEPSWDHRPDQWNAPKLEGDWKARFPKDGSAWQDAHERTMQPFVTGAVCNDVAAILARARGLPIGSATSIMGIAKDVVRVANASGGAARPAPAPVQREVPYRDVDPNAPVPPWLDQPVATGDEHVGLFRPQTFAELRAGDILFWMQWTPVAGEGVREAHIVVPEHVNGMAMPPPPEHFAKKEKALEKLKRLVAAAPGFAEALWKGLPYIDALDSLTAKRGEVSYAIQRNRGTDPNDPGKRLADRIVRAYTEDTKVAEEASERDPDGDSSPTDASADDAPSSSPGATATTSTPRDGAGAEAAAVVVHQALTYKHIGTAIDVRGSSVLFLETDAPIGVKERLADVLVNPLCMWGRIPAGKAPDLAWFLDPHNLVDPGRLDRDE